MTIVNMKTMDKTSSVSTISLNSYGESYERHDNIMITYFLFLSFVIILFLTSRLLYNYLQQHTSYTMIITFITSTFQRSI